MSILRNIMVLLILWSLTACGPETIFVRPYLDTPDLHVRNGNALIQQKKWDDADREFRRATELDPAHTEAYIGLGIVYAHGGDMAQGLRMLRHAEAIAKNDEERAAVSKAVERMHRIQSDQEVVR